METLANAQYDPETDECTIEMLRNALGLSNRRIAQLYDEGVVYKLDGQRGRYLFKASVHGYLKYLKNKNRVATENPLVIQRHEAIVRIKRADALAKERENARAESRLTPTAGLAEKVESLCDAVFEILDQIVPRIKKRRPDMPEWVLELVDQEVGKARTISKFFNIGSDVDLKSSFTWAGLNDDDDELV